MSDEFTLKWFQQWNERNLTSNTRHLLLKAAAYQALRSRMPQLETQPFMMASWPDSSHSSVSVLFSVEQSSLPPASQLCTCQATQNALYAIF